MYQDLANSQIFLLSYKRKFLVFFLLNSRVAIPHCKPITNLSQRPYCASRTEQLVLVITDTLARLIKCIIYQFAFFCSSRMRFISLFHRRRYCTATVLCNSNHSAKCCVAETTATVSCKKHHTVQC